MKHFLFIGTLLLMAVSCHGLQQTQSVKNTLVIDSLPAPKDEEIRKIQTADKWHNPFVVVYADGFELTISGEKRTNAHLTLAELVKKLLDLSFEQWPLGKVIAVSETGLSSPGDDSNIDANLRALKRMIGSYKIRIDLWPSA
jgi:hypothetical protein